MAGIRVIGWAGLDSKGKMKILIAYHYFPHYRLPVMRALLHDKDIQYTFLGGQAFDKTIKIVEPNNIEGELSQWESVKNIWLLNGKFLWQSRICDSNFC